MPNNSATIRQVDYSRQAAEIRAVRFAVFVDEQNVPPDIEMDDRDPLCVHLLACVEEQPIGTARIDLAYAGKIGRLAVLADYRRQGIGLELMQRCHGIAKKNGLSSVWCNAQIGAIPFYERIGYSATGPSFEEAGIEHVKMTLAV